MRTNTMGRFGPGTRLLNKRLNRLESRITTSDFPRAMKEYCYNGKIPATKAMMARINLVLEATKAMIETMPQNQKE